MPKHNNIIPNGHFKKDWQNRVRVWLDQPARKQRRRNNRAKKASRIFPRPTESLRPAVRCPTVRYNNRLRYGRGFTLDELKAAEIPRRFAKTIGISVDHRRKNKSVEGFQRNVRRLKVYQSKLVLFPRSANKAPKANETAYSELPNQVQHKGHVLPITRSKGKVPKARKITDEEKSASVVAQLKKARKDQRTVGRKNKKSEK